MMQVSPKTQAAKKLARQHYKVEPRLKKVFLIEPLKEDDPQEPIKLLEVVAGAIERGIEPLTFPSNSGLGIPFSSIIVELSPKEYKSLQKGDLRFDLQSWQVGAEIPR